MKTTIEKLENDRVAIEVEVDAERVEEALERAYRKVVRTLNVPGFRKGKVPRAVIERRFGVEILYEDAIDELLPVAYREALKEHALEPIDQPEIDIQEFQKGRPFRFKAEVQLKPTVTLGEYKGIELTKRKPRVTEADVDTVLRDLQEQHAQLVVADRETVEQGDFVLIDFEGFIDGEPFSGGAAKGYVVEVGAGRMIAGFEEQLVGAKLGETTEVRVTFPEDYRSEELAGKEALFRVTVQEIKVKQLPELNDEFAQEVSEKESLAELRGLIRENLEKDAENRAMSALRDEAVQKVSEGASVHIPEVLIHREAHRMVHELSHRLGYQGLTLEAYLEATERTVEDLENEFRPDAERRVKAALVLDAVAEAEGIQVEESDVEARIDEYAAGLDEENAKAVRAYWQKEENREDLVSSIRTRKTIDFIVANARITEVEADAGDSLKEAESEAQGAADDAQPGDARSEMEESAGLTEEENVEQEA